MPHKKKEIKVAVHKPLKQNMEEFQNRVNRTLAEIVEIRLEKEEMETKRKIHIISELERVYAIK